MLKSGSLRIDKRYFNQTLKYDGNNHNALAFTHALGSTSKAKKLVPVCISI